MIVDEINLLPQFYATSDISIIGGSFCEHEGHNPLQAIWYEKAVIVGPNHKTYKSVIEKLQEEKAIIISDIHNITNDVLKLYNNEENKNNMGKKAKKVLEENKLALTKHIEVIKTYIEL